MTSETSVNRPYLQLLKAVAMPPFGWACAAQGRRHGHAKKAVAMPPDVNLPRAVVMICEGVTYPGVSQPV